ncbi:MAG: hypothetical protein E7184_00720 [Erysipelotrichaceae bacterium]|nr:hypothetical protein [Erysipelotrichaceae bacterium]
MKRFSMLYGDYHNPIDNPQVLEQIKGKIYEENFLELKKNDFVYYIFDNEKNSIVGYCNGQYCNSFPMLNEEDPIIYIFKLQVFSKYQKQGFTQVFLDKITEHAKKLNVPFIALFSVDFHTKTYWKNDFLSYLEKDNMFKIVDSNIKTFAVLLREALNNCLENKNHLIEELEDIIEHKKYDNMLEYNIVKEDIYDENYNVKNAYKKIDKKLKDLFFENKMTPIIIKDLQEKLDFNGYDKESIYKELELCLQGFIISDSEKYIEKIRLIYASMFLLEADHKVSKELNKNY